MTDFPLTYDLKDKTHVLVNELEAGTYEFHLTRLNSEKYNFTCTLTPEGEQVEDSYALRFNELEQEALSVFRERMLQADNSGDSA